MNAGFPEEYYSMFSWPLPASEVLGIVRAVKRVELAVAKMKNTG